MFVPGRQHFRDADQEVTLSCFFMVLITRSRYIASVVFMLAMLMLSACAGKTAYYRDLNDLVGQERYLDAARLVEKSKSNIYGDKNALLFYLDRGMLLHLAGSYAESNEYFERAKQLAEKYFTKSVTTEASTFLVSDNVRPYYGEDFERALISVFSAMNYVMLGKPSEALVEARQVDHFLKTLRVDHGYKNKYNEDAFARYLMGMLYENQGKINDAFISYRQALDAYSRGRKIYGVAAPRDLVNDALRTAKRLGFTEEIREITGTWGGATEKGVPASFGEVVVIDYNGFSAEKVEHIFEIAFGRAWAYVNVTSPRGAERQQVEQAGAIARSILFDEQVRMAFPRYERIPNRITRFRAVASGSPRVATSEIVDNISAIAEQSLDDRIARIRVKTVARAAVRFALIRELSRTVERESGNSALGWITQKALTAGSTVVEHADLRSWRSLPDTILIGRLKLAAGKHTISITCYDQYGKEVRRETLKDVVVKRGKKTFAILRTAI
jgi:hypothetical protein